MIKKGQKFSQYLVIDENGKETEKLKTFADEIGYDYFKIRRKMDFELEQQTLRLNGKNYIVIKTKTGKKI